MFLAFDIGNSQIKAGLFSGNKIVKSFIFRDLVKVKSLYSNRDIAFTGISSVVPAKSDQLKKFLNLQSYSYYQITKNSKFNLKLLYKTPETLGIDRICSAEGAFYLNNKMNRNQTIISIDFGTATTMNVISYPGRFIGGVIAPGIKLMSESLHFNTAQLPIITIRDFHGDIGMTTKESIASGIVNSTIGMIERIVDYVKVKYKSKKIKIFLTGGNAEHIIPYFNFDFIFEKNLVLFGIKNITDLNS